MKILFLVSRLPYVLDKGDKLRAYHQLRFLARQHQIILFALSDEAVPAGAVEHLETFCEAVVVYPLSRSAAFRNMLKRLPKSWPLQVAFFYDAGAQQRLDALVQEYQPDHLFCQLVRMAPYVRKYPHLPKTLDYMDAFSKGMERRMKAVPFYQKPFFYLEFQRLRRYESRIFSFFNQKVIISEQDRYFIQHPQKYNIQVVPNGVDCDFFQPQEGAKEMDILFSGNLSYPPNIEACLYLVKKIVPLVRPHFPRLQVLLAGKDPVPAVLDLASDCVTVRANLPDMREAYAQARLFVAPLFLGTGLQNKLLEAMAMGLPCLTTRQVNNALGAKKVEHILLAENAQGFAAHILYLLHHPEEARQMGRQARQLVQRQYTWDLVNSRLEALLQPAG